MDSLSLKLCDIQGRLFELAAKQGYAGEKFVSFFMNSDVAENLDSIYNRMQWAGEEYLLEEVIDGCNGEISYSEEPVSSEMMYWIGYIYRCWHFYKNEPSRKIYSQANFKTMKRNYMIFHTMDPELAIDDLIEIKNQMVVPSEACGKIGSASGSKTFPISVRKNPNRKKTNKGVTAGQLK